MTADAIMAVWAERGYYRVECRACPMACSARAATIDVAAHSLPCHGLASIDRTIAAIRADGAWTELPRMRLSSELEARADEADRKTLERWLAEIDVPRRRTKDEMETAQLREMARKRFEEGR